MALTLLGLAAACAIARQLLAAIGSPIPVAARRIVTVAERRPRLVPAPVRLLAVAPKTSPPRV